jgi:RNA polymerase sigma-70 factor (ECF subfamily)
MTDEQIVARVVAGETALYELILRRHNARLFRAARAILGNDADAEDAVQQAYISAYDHLAQFHGEARLSTWLTRIVIRAALARARSASRRAEVGLEGLADEEIMSLKAGDDPEAKAAGSELRVIVERAVDELPEIYRLAFVLREVQQLSTAEAAECLEVSEEVIKIRLHRAKAMLREHLDARLDAAAPELFAFLGPRCDAIVQRVMAALAARR